MRNFAPQMEKDMQSYRLSDLVKIKNGKDHKMLSNGKYPVLGSGGIMRYVDKFLYDKPSVLLPRKGTLDNIQYCDMPFWTVDTLYYTEVNTNLANPYYLYRYLSLLDLSNLDSGTGVPSMTFDNYYGLKIFLPNIEKQTKIAQILQTLDKKITINRQINQNLEAMAKQLYDYWFVQFDFPNEEGKPYKSSGGEMVWNEKLRKDIPEYWEVKSLSNWLEIKSGFPFKSETYKPIGRYKIITIKNVQDGELVTSGCDYVNEIPSRAKDYISLQIGDRLISLTGNCGRLCVVCEENLLLNQRVGLLCCDAIYLEYFYNFLNSSTMRTVIDNLANGAAQANLSPVELCKTDYFIPPIDILLSYNRKANAIRKVIVQNNQEISPLTKQRDELLPLLMNGQVSVNSDLSLG